MNSSNIVTAMVSMALSKVPSTIFGENGAEITATSYWEGLERVFNWRKSLNLNLSIAARGATEGLWYVDFSVTPIFELMFQFSFLRRIYNQSYLSYIILILGTKLYY